MQPYDLVIVGAGPAGAASAITARSRGLSVLLCDRARFPRDKTCGDGLTANALRLLERLGVSLGARRDGGGYVSVRTTVLVAPGGRRVVLDLPRDGEFAGVAARRDLDAAIVEVARRRGADLTEGVEVVDVVADHDAVKVALADGRAVEARYLVAADGHWSTVRRRLHPDLPRDLGEWHAARQYFRGVADRRLWVVFDASLLPGYAWVFPLPDSGANVGFGVLRSRDRTGRELRRLWDAVLDLPALRELLAGAAAEGPVRAWPIPARYEPAALSDGPVLYAGDAARLVDPMTGEGIAQALESGVLAAEAIAGGGDHAAVGARYRAAVHRAIGRDVRFAHRLQGVLRHRAGTETALRVAGLTAWTRRNFARWMFEDYPRALLLTPDRWHRGAFGGRGAFRAG